MTLTDLSELCHLLDGWCFEIGFNSVLNQLAGRQIGRWLGVCPIPIKAGPWSPEYYFWGNLMTTRSLYAYRGSCAKTLAILTSREDYR